MSLTIDIALDAASLARVQAFANYDATLEPELAQAMRSSVNALQDYAYRYMWSTFQNPSGQIEDSLGTGVDGPYSAWMGTDSPYGRRLELGFSGMTDALGRYFAAWPIASPDGYRWAEVTAQEQKGEVTRYFNLALLRSAISLSAGGTTP